MPRISASFCVSECSIAAGQLARYVPGWIMDGEARRLSPCTMESRRWLADKLLWFLGEQNSTECGVPELRAFLAYVSNGHRSEGGRWNNALKRTEVKDGTAATYHARLRTLFRFLVGEGVLQESPMERINKPINRPDQVQPFTTEQVEKLLQACKHPSHARSRRRNEAIILLLLDTGMRASELCGLKVQDLDLVGSRRCTVLGKGNKRRALPLDKITAKAIWQYLAETEDERDADGPVFLGDRGRKASEPLTRSGLLQLIGRLGETAGIEAARCSPHTFRHTFAVEFLRAGGNVFTLKELLGHTTLTMVNRYVALAQADIENQHRQYSPVARLKRGGR